MSDTSPLILAFDTSGPYCAAALMQGAKVLASAYDPMKRGQAEHLMTMLERVLNDANTQWNDLSAIGVGVGPGNFTGIRISVSAARGLALGLAIPAVGVSTFQALSLDHSDPHIAAVPAPRDQLYVLHPDTPSPMLAAPPHAFDLPIHLPPSPDQLVVNIARYAATGYTKSPVRPAPLYIKPADAAPPRDPAPVIFE
ncbi:tRNA (adenosine(37)-N6)-threonylcarbamoyltransferase complex dimerization subunit type 1 TsaB [Shimia sp.]|uniref:tRNA (adenosine(37)-N6)-threonylcarbamoyltransferase complex dimerization subunit type 1 TsaB n=1 Tax=Shimia sp. TaxID=1954381 RepID=UPI0032992406